jgi:multiple sugar transport system permease protein
MNSKSRGRQSTKKLLAQGSLLVPAAILILPLVVIIIVQVFQLVTHDENLMHPGSGDHWVGFDNFIRAFSDPTLGESIRITIIYVVVGISFEMVIGVGIALLLNGRMPGKGILRALILIPMVVTPVVAGLMWRLLLDPTSGFVNYLLGILGFGHHAFLADPNTALMVVIIVEIWENTPFVITIVLAGLESLDASQFEAAQLDGAHGWKLIRYITLPMLGPILAIVMLLRLIDGVKTFALIATMTQGGPGTSTLAISFYVQRLGFETFDVGYATTVGFIVSVAVIVLLFPTATKLMGLRIRRANR